MRSLICVLFLSLGCASFEVVYQPDGPEGSTTVVKSSAYGRGCVAVDASVDGTVSVVVAQDGTSDWSISRMFAFIAEIVGQMPLIGANTNPDEMEEPDAAQGCSGIFEESNDTADGLVNTEDWNEDD